MATAGDLNHQEDLIYSFRLPGQGWYSQILGFLGERKSLDNLWDLWLFRWFSHCKPWKKSWNWIGALFHDEKHNDNTKVPTGLVPSHSYKKCMKILGSNLSVSLHLLWRLHYSLKADLEKHEVPYISRNSLSHSAFKPFCFPRLSLPACTSAVIACVPRRWDSSFCQVGFCRSEKTSQVGAKEGGRALRPSLEISWLIATWSCWILVY